jgi:hypothetical protein
MYVALMKQCKCATAQNVCDTWNNANVPLVRMYVTLMKQYKCATVQNVCDTWNDANVPLLRMYVTLMKQCKCATTQAVCGTAEIMKTVALLRMCVWHLWNNSYRATVQNVFGTYEIVQMCHCSGCMKQCKCATAQNVCDTYEIMQMCHCSGCT